MWPTDFLLAQWRSQAQRQLEERREGNQKLQAMLEEPLSSR